MRVRIKETVSQKSSNDDDDGIERLSREFSVWMDEFIELKRTQPCWSQSEEK